MMMLLDRVNDSAVTRTRTGRYRGLGRNTQTVVGSSQQRAGSLRPSPDRPCPGTCSPRRRRTGACAGW